MMETVKNVGRASWDGMNMIEATEVIREIYVEMYRMKARFGDVPIEIYATQELAYELMKVTTEQGYVYKVDPADATKSTVWGCPFYAILEHRTEKPYRVVVTSGTG